MTALLDVPEVRERVMRVSVADYHRHTEGQRTELLRGIVIEKMPSSPLHSFIAEELREVLAGQLKPGFIALHERALTTSDSEPVPEVMVVRGSRADFRATHPSTAELVIEVAVSSLEIDRVKALIYAEAGVKEYWIVCPKEKRVEVYRQLGEKGYSEHTVIDDPTVLECIGLPGIWVDFGGLLASEVVVAHESGRPVIDRVR